MLLYSSCFSAEEDDQAITYADVRFTQHQGRQVAQTEELEVEAEYAHVILQSDLGTLNQQEMFVCQGS